VSYRFRRSLHQQHRDVVVESGIHIVITRSDNGSSRVQS